MERQLLEYLEGQPITDWVDLINYFRDTYPSNYNKIAKDIKVLLDELFGKEELIYLANPSDYQVLGQVKNDNPSSRNTFEDLEELDRIIHAKISFKGRQYLNELRRLEKQDSINNTQKLSNIFIAIFTFVLTVVAIITCVKDNQESKPKDKKPLLQLQKKLQSIDSALNSHIRNDSVFQRQVRDSLRISQ